MGKTKESLGSMGSTEMRLLRSVKFGTGLNKTSNYNERSHSGLWTNREKARV
jgi:hypothetical protein